MNNLFHPSLNGQALAKKLCFWAEALKHLGVVLTCLILVIGLIFSISLLTIDSDDLSYGKGVETGVGAMMGALSLVGTIIGSAYTLGFWFLMSLLLKSFASVVLHSYISALHTEEDKDQTSPHA